MGRSSATELVELVESGDLLPSRDRPRLRRRRQCDLPAQHGFQVTAVDFSPAAIDKAKAKARKQV